MMLTETLMASDDRESRASAIYESAAQWKIGRSIFLRRAARQAGFIAASLLAGFVIGVAYRAAFDPADERTLADFLRSGFYGAGIALTIWTVQNGFAAGDRSRLGNALRRLPLAAEVVVRALVMTAALIVVGFALQFLLYVEPYRLAHQTMVDGQPAQNRSARFRNVAGHRRGGRNPATDRRRASDQCSPGHLSPAGPQAADRDVPRPRQFDAPRRGDGRASRPRPYHALLFRYRRADQRLRRRGARLCRRRGHRELARDRRPGAQRAMLGVLLCDPAQDRKPRGRL